MNLLLRLALKFCSWIWSHRSLKVFALIVQEECQLSIGYGISSSLSPILIHPLLWLIRVSLPNLGVIVLSALTVVSKGIPWTNAISSMGIPLYINPNWSPLRIQRPNQSNFRLCLVPGKCERKKIGRKNGRKEKTNERNINFFTCLVIYKKIRKKKKRIHFLLFG